MKTPPSEGDDDLDEIVRAVARAPALVPAQRTEVTNRLGTVLRGKYLLEGVLGVGGMAVVYRAIHRNQAEYAIKMLLPEHSGNADVRYRFLREGYAANSVKHSGAVRVVDDDVAEDGTAFLVLELLHGLSCDKLCSAQGGRLSIEAACAIGLQTLDVLHSAHVNGIIHRDIKPANLFMLRTGEIKVLDFGIARVRETLATSGYTTGSGLLLGTPAFMAPEQAMGKASDVDARADIWAVGATLFAMISGLTVHEGDSGRELLVKLVTRPTRSLLTVVPEIPRALADVVDRALAVDRENRWPSAAAMRDGLEEASHQLWEERPARAVLSSLAETIALGSPPDADVSHDREKQQRSPALPAAPTLRAQGSPEVLEGPPIVETARPVSREGKSFRPRRRISLFVVVATLALGAGVAALAVMTGRGREGSVQPFSPMAGGASPMVSMSAPGNDPSPPPTGSEVARTVDAVLPSVDPAPLPTAGGRSVRPRSLPRPDRNATATSAAALPTAPSSSSAPASPPGQIVPAASQRPASCTPPFYYDSKLNRVFKKECL